MSEFKGQVESWDAVFWGVLSVFGVEVFECYVFFCEGRMGRELCILPLGRILPFSVLVLVLVLVSSSG